MFCNFSSNFFKNLSSKVNLVSLKYGYRQFASSASAFSEKLNIETMQIPNHIKPLINRPTSEILSEIDPENTSPIESVTFLKAFRMQALFKNIPPESFRTDSQFLALCDVFQKNCSNLNHSLLISGLRSLLEVGLPCDSPCVVSAEHEIFKKCQEFSTFNIIQCLYFHHKYTDSDLQKQVLIALRDALLDKLSQISSSSEVLLLAQLLCLFSEKDRESIELRIVQLIPILTVNEMIKVIISLGQKSQRSVSILNAVAFHMRQNKEVPRVREVVDLLYAFKKLNYTDQMLFFYLLNPVVKEIPNITNPSLISGLLTTCGHLKWRDIELLDACTEWIKVNFHLCRLREFIAFVLTSATLNYSNSKTWNLLKLVMPSLTLENVGSSQIFLDIAWSLEILNNIPKDLLLKILSPEFYDQLLSEQETPIQVTNKLKLLNLKGVLKLRYPEHVFGCNLYLEPIKLKESSEVENSRKHVINVLSNFVPKNKCLITHQCNEMGIFIDAVFIMDKNLKPLNLSEYGMTGTSTTKSKVLPLGAKKFALLVLFYKDYTKKLKSLIGVNALAVKLLTLDGYYVVQISFEEFMKNETEVQKAKHILQKIKVLSNVGEKSS